MCAVEPSDTSSLSVLRADLQGHCVSDPGRRKRNSQTSTEAIAILAFPKPTFTLRGLES